MCKLAGMGGYNLFNAIKKSLEKLGLDFSRAVSFIWDTTNVMKGATCRSGVQKLIKDEKPCVYDAGYLSHLATDLVVKAKMEVSPIDIDQLFVLLLLPSQ